MLLFGCHLLENPSPFLASAAALLLIEKAKFAPHVKVSAGVACVTWRECQILRG